MKFKYAPGLPGYGTRGIDGSTGLSGLGMYFCSYDGTSDSITIKSKIIANKILFSIDEPLSNGRTYQTGDLFIDKNGKVFRIDLNEVNLYTNTNSLLNTSGFLENSGLKTEDDKYDRLSNAYSSSKFLIDVVYTDIAPGNYAINPGTVNGGIYNTNSIDFAQVKYVDRTPNGYYPFTVFTTNTNTLSPQDAIALTREETNNIWHLGNLDSGGLVRDVSLHLDFSTVYSPGDIATAGTFYGNFEGSVETENLQLDGWLNVGGDVSTFGMANFFNYTTDNEPVVKIFKLANITDQNPALVVGCDGEASDIIVELRSAIDGDSVDTGNDGLSADAKFQVFGDGDVSIAKNLEVGGTLLVRNNTTIQDQLTVQSEIIGQQFIEAGGYVEADETFRSAGNSLILGTGSSGTVRIRPAGSGSSTDQSYFNTSELYIGTNLEVNGTTEVNGNILSSDGSQDIGTSDTPFNAIYADEFNGDVAASNITGTLGVAHGGTGVASFTGNRVILSTAGGTVPLATSADLQWDGTNLSVDGNVIPIGSGCYLGSAAAPWTDAYINDRIFFETDGDVLKFNNGIDIATSSTDQTIKEEGAGGSITTYYNDAQGEQGFYTVREGGFFLTNMTIEMNLEQTVSGGSPNYESWKMIDLPGKIMTMKVLGTWVATSFGGSEIINSKDINEYYTAFGGYPAYYSGDNYFSTGSSGNYEIQFWNGYDGEGLYIVWINNTSNTRTMTVSLTMWLTIND